MGRKRWSSHGSTTLRRTSPIAGSAATQGGSARGGKGHLHLFIAPERGRCSIPPCLAGTRTQVHWMVWCTPVPGAAQHVATAHGLPLCNIVGAFLIHTLPTCGRRCKKQYERHRSSIDTARHVCGKCGGRLQYLGRFGKAGQLLVRGHVSWWATRGGDSSRCLTQPVSQGLGVVRALHVRHGLRQLRNLAALIILRLSCLKTLHSHLSRVDLLVHQPNPGSCFTLPAEKCGPHLRLIPCVACLLAGAAWGHAGGHAGSSARRRRSRQPGRTAPHPHAKCI